MDYKKNKIQELIFSADIEFNMLLDSIYAQEYYFAENFITERQKYIYINNYSQQMGIILEKYFKAIYLKKLEFPKEITEELNKLIKNDSQRIGVNYISYEDEINLLMSSTDSRTNYLYKKLPKTMKNTLNEISFKGISHDFSKILNKEKINMNDYGVLASKMSIIFKLPNEEKESDDLKKLTYIEKLIREESYDHIETINKSEVKDAFPNGRYSAITYYIPNFNYLMFLITATKKALPEIFNGIQISSKDDISEKLNKTVSSKASTYFSAKSITIFPDLESKLQIFRINKIEECFFGEYKKVSIYECQNNQLQQKPTKKIYEEINKAKKEIGLYSNNPWAKYISELNVYNNTMDFRLNDNEFIIYIHNEEQKSILCKNKNIYEVSMEYIKENYPDRLSMLDESEKKDKPPKF